MGRGVEDDGAMATTVLQLSDTHLRRRAGAGEDGSPDPDTRLATVLDAWEATGERADLVVLTGDLADDASVGAYERLRAAVAPLDARILALPGNHDDPHALGAALGTAGTAEVGTWRVVAVDTSRPGDVHGTVDVPATLAQLDELDERPTVLAIHHPPRSRSTHPWFRLDGADELMDGLATRPHVKVVISGHLHDPFELASPTGLPLLGAPSTWVPIAHHDDRYEIGAGGPAGARVLHLADDGTFTTELLPA